MAAKTASPLATAGLASAESDESGVLIVTRVGTGVTGFPESVSSLSEQADKAMTKTSADTTSSGVTRENGDRRIDRYPIFMTDRSQTGAGIAHHVTLGRSDAIGENASTNAVFT